MEKPFSILLSIIALFLLPVLPVGAHVASEEKEERIEAIIVEPDLFTAKTSTTIWLEVKDIISNQNIANLDINVKVQNLAGEEVFSGKAEPKSAEGGKTHYVFEFTFPAGGEYKIGYGFTRDNKQKFFSFPVTVSEPVKEGMFSNNLLKVAGVAVAGFILLAVTIWGLTKKHYKKLIIFLVVVGVGGIVAHSLFVTFRTGATKSGVVTCLADGTCFWTAHIHSYIVIKACGEEKHLPAEVGLLSKSHTHEEQNIFHWHDRLPYDNSQKAILDTKPLTLGSSFDNIGVSFDKSKILNFKNGDKCPDGKEGTWKMFVNGKHNEEFRDYVWRDKDIIVLVFDSRSKDEVEQELKITPVNFPALGRG